jgi:hypothetical protein
MHPCSRSMTCPNSWTASDRYLSSSRCAQRPWRPPTQMMPDPRDHMINAITTLKCCTDAFLFFVLLYHHYYLESPTRPVPFFTHHSFFTGSRRLQDNWYISCCILLVFLFFFVMRAVQPRCIHHYHPRPPRLLSSLCAIPSRFCTHLTPGLPFNPTRAYLWIPWNDRYV